MGKSYQREAEESGYVELSDLVGYLVERSGKSAARVSREIGRTSGYLGSVIHRESVPTAGTLADIAAACGYSLYLVGESDLLRIEPVHVGANDDVSARAWSEIEAGKAEIMVIDDIYGEDYP